MFVATATLADIDAQHAAVASLCSSLDPALLPADDVPRAFELVAEMQKMLGGASIRMASRYEQVGAWKRNGARSAEDDIARRTGTSPSRAKRTLNTSRKLRKLSGTDDALKRGDLSPEQADEVASGADASPDEEDELLMTARKESLHTLRRKAAEARAKADRDREVRRARQHGMRRVSRWTDDDGLYNLLLKLPPELGSEIDAALKPGIDRAYADARDAGRFETYEAYAADVVYRRLAGRDADGSTGSRNQAVRPDRKVIGFIDVAALNRGYTVGDERCDIAGVGPVSVSALRALLSDAFVSIVLTDGVDVLNVTHLGRQVTTHQRTALEARGYQCEMENCGSTHHLEIDHITGWTFTKDTRVEDLCWLCPHDHAIKTRNRYRLVGPAGNRRFAPPEHADGRDPPEGTIRQDDLFTTAS